MKTKEEDYQRKKAELVHTGSMRVMKTENKRALQEQLDHRVNKVFWQSLIHVKSSQLSNAPAREVHK